MYIRARTKRLLIQGGIGLLVLAAIIVGIYAYMNTEISLDTTPTENTNVKSEEESEVYTGPYTRYNAAEGACQYHFSETESCYVPLSLCVLDPTVKKEQTLDQEKYCSDTPELKAEALKTETGQCPFRATEGDLLDLISIATDPDERDPTYPFGPAGSLLYKFSEPFADTNGVWQTKNGDAGVVNFNVEVSDGEYTVNKDYCIQIDPSNRPPFLSNVNDMTIVAGEVVKFNPTCVDPDGDKISVTYQSFLEDRNWMTSDERKTEDKDIGKHGVTITCADKYGLKDVKSVVVTVIPKNPKVAGNLVFMSGTEDKTMYEGDTVTLNPIARGAAEGKTINYGYKGWMTSNKKTAGYTDAGEHFVTITANDGESSISHTVTITVINVNRPPEIVSTDEEGA